MTALPLVFGKHTGMRIGDELVPITYSNLCQEIYLDHTPFKVIQSGLVDGELWYTCYTRETPIWKWILSQNEKYWKNIPGAPAFDIHESLYTLLLLKFSK